MSENKYEVVKFIDDNIDYMADAVTNGYFVWCRYQ